MRRGIDRVAYKAVFVPGGVTPSALGYAALVSALGEAVDPTFYDLALYAGDAAPAGYNFGMEVEGIARTADQAGLENFELVGYSTGFALAFAAAYPARVRSLTLVETAWIGNDDWRESERARRAELRRIVGLPSDERMAAYVRLSASPAASSVPAGPAGSPPPPWMAKRSAALGAMIEAELAASLDREALRQFSQPVYLPIGGRSHPRFHAIANVLAGSFPNASLEVFEQRDHLDPPHRAEPERFARALLSLWASTPLG